MNVYSLSYGAYYAFFGAQLLFLIPAGLLIAARAASYADFLPVLLLFFLVGGGLKEPMENMMSMVLHSKRISEGVARIDRILRQEELETTGDASPSSYDVVFENVSFSYGADDTQAVKNLGFKLPSGEDQIAHVINE